MPLNSAPNLNASISWALAKTNTGYSSTTQSDSASFNLSGVSATTYSQLYTATFTIATTASQTIDLTSVTNLVSESVVFTKVLSIFIEVATSECTFSAGASNGLTWFLTGTTPAIVIPAGGMFMFSLPATSSGQTVDGTHKTLKLLSSGAGTTSVTITVIGGTT